MKCFRSRSSYSDHGILPLPLFSESPQLFLLILLLQQPESCLFNIVPCFIIHYRNDLLETLYFFQSNDKSLLTHRLQPHHSIRLPGLGPFYLKMQHYNSTTSVLITATLIYTIGAGITAAAGTRLALQLISQEDLVLVHSFKKYPRVPQELFVVTTSSR